MVPALCRHLILLELEVALMVASILVGPCMLLFIFSVPLIFCSLPCNLPLISTIRIAYAPLYLVFSSLILLAPVYCLCNILENFPCVLMDP